MRLLSAALLAAGSFILMPIDSQDLAGFAGMWRQDVSTVSTRTKGRSPRELVVKIEGDTLSINRTGSGQVHSVVTRMRIGGAEVTYKGLDGDEFHVKVNRVRDGLSFDGREYEDGHKYQFHEVWTLRGRGEGQVLVETRDAKDPDESAQTVTEYDRVSQ